VRGHGGLNPSLASNGRGLLSGTATLFKMTRSAFSQVKIFISKPTGTAGLGGEGSWQPTGQARNAILSGVPLGVLEPGSQHGCRTHRPSLLGQ